MPLRRVVMPIAAYMAQFGPNDIATLPQMIGAARNVDGVPMVDYLTMEQAPAAAEFVAVKENGVVTLERGDASVYARLPFPVGRWEVG